MLPWPNHCGSAVFFACCFGTCAYTRKRDKWRSLIIDFLTSLLGTLFLGEGFHCSHVQLLIYSYHYLLFCSGTHLFCTGNLGPTQYICVAIKNKAIIYELVHSKQRYMRKKEVMVSSPTIHCMMMFNDKLCVGYQSGFSLFNVYLEEPEKSKIIVVSFHTTDNYIKPHLHNSIDTSYPLSLPVLWFMQNCFLNSLELVNTEDLTLGFVRINELNAMTAVEINNGQEYLLCFHCESLLLQYGHFIIPLIWFA